MSNEGRYVLLTGVKDTHAVNTYFASSLVDVAYVMEVSGSRMKVVPDIGIDLGNLNDVEWLTGLLVGAMVDCEEPEVRIEIYAEE